MSEKEGHQSVNGSGFAIAAQRDPLSSTPSPASRGQPNPLSRGLHRVLLRLAHYWFWLSRGMTLGVRAIVVNDQGAIFLVRHTYVPGWHLPGGGVEWGQTAEEALTAELLEEGHLELLAPPVLLGVYAQRSVSRRDHVLLYLATRIRQTRSRLPDREIAESGFFALDALPADTTRATRHRLAEWQGDEPRSPVWDASHGASQAREA